MSGIFRPGQLVRVVPGMLGPREKLELFNVPGGIERVDADVDHVYPIGWLMPHDVALIIGRERTLGGEVYVLGPHGGGWAPAALLKAMTV